MTSAWEQLRFGSSNLEIAHKKGPRQKPRALPIDAQGVAVGKFNVRHLAPSVNAPEPLRTKRVRKQPTTRIDALKVAGAQNAPGSDFRRAAEHLALVRGLHDRRNPRDAVALGNTRNTPDDPKRPSKTTPHLIADPSAHALAREYYRDRVTTAETLARWGAAGARARRVEPTGLPGRAFQLRDMGRLAHPARRCADCGFRPIGEVALMRRPDGGHTIGGVLTCGSVWACPVCAMKIKRGRAEQIKAGVSLHRQHHGEHSLAMLTMTLRHDATMSLQSLKDGYQAAHDDFWRKVPAELKERNRWARICCQPTECWKEDSGFVGYLSGTEMTFGSHGWHYHRHYILAFDRNQKQEEISELMRILNAHWKDCVAKHLPLCVPGRDARGVERGLDLRLLVVADYLAKLGLEVADVGTKVASGGNVTQWGLLSGAASGNGQALDAFAEYVYAMKGSKCIQIGDRLKKHWERLGIDTEDNNDEALADDSKGAVLVLEIPRGAWMRMRCSGRVRQMLEAADAGTLPDLSGEAPWSGWGDGERAEREAIADRPPPESSEERRARLALERSGYWDSLFEFLSLSDAAHV